MTDAEPADQYDYAPARLCVSVHTHSSADSHLWTRSIFLFASNRLIPSARFRREALKQVHSGVANNVSYARRGDAGRVSGCERRRRWDDEVKLSIVSSVGIGGATVTRMAQRHEVARQQVYAWRHELRRKGLWSPDAGALFLPAGMVPAMALPVVGDRTPTATPVVWVELRLANPVTYFICTAEPVCRPASMLSLTLGTPSKK